MNGLKLTVVTATFNVVSSRGHDLLMRCLASVSKLPFAHEHLVMDGASSDGTLAVLEEAAANDSSIRVFSSPDRGIYDALNKAVSLARGEWMLVLGADDCVSDGDALAHLLNRKRSDDIGIVMTKVILDGRRYPHDQTGMFDLFRGTMSVCHQGMLMRTKLIARLGGFDDTYRIVGDYDLILRAVFSGTGVETCPDVCFSVFETGGVSGCQSNAMSEYVRCVSERFGIANRNLALQIVHGRPLPAAVLNRLVRDGSPYAVACARRQLVRRRLSREDRPNCRIYRIQDVPIFVKWRSKKIFVRLWRRFICLISMLRISFGREDCKEL